MSSASSGCLLQRLAHLLELGLVDLATLLAHLLGQLVHRVARLLQLVVGQGVAGGLRELRLLHLLADLLELLFERFLVGFTPGQELLLEGLHAAEGFGPVEALVGDVVDELVELLDGGLRIVALIFLLQLLEKVLHVLEIVGGHLHRVDGGRVGHRDVVANLEQEDDHEKPSETHRRSQRSRHRQTDGGARLRLRHGLHRVLDGGVHEGCALGRRAKREGAGEAIVKPVEPVERARPCTVGQPPRPRHERRNRHARDRQAEHHACRSLAEEPHLAQSHAHDGDDQRRTERPCTHTERAPQPDTSLGLGGKPSNLLHSLELGAHPSLRL
jgi:hypothetical protein